MEPIVTVVEIVINMYRQTTVPGRFAYIFWSMFVLIYLYTDLYERLHGLNMKKQRKLKRWNYPATLYLLGVATITTHHLTLANGRAIPMPWDFAVLGIGGFVIMAVGLTLVCLSRASINGYWGANIYDYGSHNILVTSGIYNFTRHPTYDGQLLMSIGTVLMANNFCVIFFPVLTFIANTFRALREEKDLSERFPEAFKEYKDKRPFLMGIL